MIMKAPTALSSNAKGLPGELVQSGSCHHSWQGTCVYIISKLSYSRGSLQEKPYELHQTEKKSGPTTPRIPSSGWEP